MTWRLRFALLSGTIGLAAACGGSATPPAVPTIASAAPSAAGSSGPSVSRASAMPSPADSQSPVVADGEPWLVYQGGLSAPAQIRLVRPDGTDDHPVAPLVGGDHDQLHADWSRDGKRLAFAVDDSDGTRDLWLVNADGSNPHVLVQCADPCSYVDDPAWSPDGREILFERVTKAPNGIDGIPTLEVIGPNGGQARLVATEASINSFYQPRWAPDGHRIVVEVDRFATTRYDETRVEAGTVGTMDLDSKHPVFVPLVPWETKAAGPDWSADGDTIVFVVPADPGTPPPDGAGDLHTIRTDGTGERTLTTFGGGGGFAIEPAWTPDGDMVTFVAVDKVSEGHPNVGTIRADGTDLVRLTDAYNRTHPRLRPTP